MGQALVAKEEVEAKRVEIEAARAEVESVLNGSFLCLMDGGWGDEEVRDLSITGVCDYLSSQGSDPVLMAALPKALLRRPVERGPYDRLAVEEAQRSLSEKLEDLVAKLADGEMLKENAWATHLGA